MAILDLGKVKLNYKGDYDNTASYEKNDIVLFKSSLWLAAQDHSPAVSGKHYRAPGHRGRGLQIASYQEVDDNFVQNYHVRKEAVTGQVGLKFTIDRRFDAPLQLVRGRRYRFSLSHNSLKSGSYPSETEIDFSLCTAVDGTAYTTGVTKSGFNGRDGYLEIKVPYDAPNNLYVKQTGTSGVGSVVGFTVTDGWEGYKYWEAFTEGFSYKGSWSNVTQYNKNDVVQREGNLYIALQDHFNKDPGVLNIADDPKTPSVAAASAMHGFWKELSVRQAGTDHRRAVWLMNRNPIGFPYRSEWSDNTIYGNYKWINADGSVRSHGTGSNGSPGYHANNTSGDSYSVPIMSHQWLRSRDFNQPLWSNNNDSRDGIDRAQRQGLFGGKSNAITPHGEPPRAVQIESSWDRSYILLDNGQLLSMGYGGHGSLGYGTTPNKTEPVPVLGLEDVKIIKMVNSRQLESSTGHVICLSDQGDVYSFGYNNYGQLGTGDNNNKARAYQIPREYFDNERVVDILATGSGEASSWARTEKDNLFGWGRNNVGQLGIGDTTDRWRPAKLTGWDPTTNAGIKKLIAVGEAGNASFYILDGNGYLWHTGYGGYYQCMDTTTNNRSTITKTTQSPIAGNCVDFWVSNPNGYCMLWFRHSNGNTYTMGYSAYYCLGYGQNANQGTPVIVPGVTQLKDVKCVGSYSNEVKTVWLTDRGELFARGYENYGWSGNQEGAQSTSQSNGSDYRPIRMAIPAAEKPIQFTFIACDQTTNHFGPHLVVLTEKGRILFSGANGMGNEGRQYLGGQYYYLWNSGQMNFSFVSTGR